MSSTEITGLAGPGDTPGTAGETIRVFFSHWSPRLLAAAALAWGLIRAVVGQWSAADLLVVCGIVLIWPMQEWLIHVFVLHFKPTEVLGLRIDPSNAREHRRHHRDPWRISLVFIPWFTVFTGMFFLPLAWFTLMPTAPLALTGLATYFLMALHYEWVHYICHVRWRPPIRHYQVLADSHRLHHFKSEKHWLGVSMLMGDRIMGTAPDPRQVERSETVRTLGVDEEVAA